MKLLDNIPDALISDIIKLVPPPWSSLIKCYRVSATFAAHVRARVFDECRAMEMAPSVCEPTGFLINALRQAKCARAFYNVECRFFVHGKQEQGIDNRSHDIRGAPRRRHAWLIKLDRMKGVVTARLSTDNKKLMAGAKCIHLKPPGSKSSSDTKTRFVWAHAGKALLLTSSNESFEVVVSSTADEDGGECVELVQTEHSQSLSLMRVESMHCC